MTIPRWAVIVIRLLVPKEFAEDLLVDLSDGYERQETRRAGTRWLAAELLQTPYVALWRQALHVRPAMAWSTVFVDVGHAVRGLLRDPAFTSISLVTLTGGIACITLVTAVTDAVLLRPLPYPDDGAVYDVRVRNHPWRTSPVDAFRSNWDAMDLTGRLIGRLQRPIPGVKAIGGFRRTETRFENEGNDPALVEGAWVTAGFFEALGMSPFLGRTPSPSEIREGARVVVLENRFWRDRFGANSDVAGEIVQLDGVAHVVIGVMPMDFRLPGEFASWWAPLSAEGAAELADTPGFRAIAQLERGASPTPTASVLSGLLDEMARTDSRYASMDIRLGRVRNGAARPVRTDLGMLLGAGLLILLLAIANQATLMSARAATRGAEMATRAALGASRQAQVWALVAEGLVLCLIAGAGGILLAGQLVAPFRDLLERSVPGFPTVDGAVLSGRVVVVVCAVASITWLLSAVAPAIVAQKAPARAPAASIRWGVHTMTRRTHRSLLVGEAAMVALLAVAAGQLVRNAAHLSNVDPGFDASSVAYVRILLPDSPDGAAADHIGTRLERELERLPGVESVASSDGLPGFGSWNKERLRTLEQTPPQAALRTIVSVSPGYFRTMGIRVLRGRTFRPDDDVTRVVVLGERLAGELFGGDAAIGRPVVIGVGTTMEGAQLTGAGETTATVIGVASDVRLTPDDDPEPIVYTLGPDRGSDLHIAVRTNSSWTLPVDTLSEVIRAAVPSLLVRDAGLIDDAMSRWSAPSRLRMALVVIIAALAALVAGAGVYGVIGYVVWTQRHEIGLRLALGAPAVREVPRVVREALGPVAGGTLAGLAAGWIVGRAAAGPLAGGAALDPTTCIIALLLSLLPAALAAGLASRRILSVDPTRILAGGQRFPSAGH